MDDRQCEELVWIIDHAKLVMSVVFTQDFALEGAYFEVSPKQSGSGGSTSVRGIDERRTATQFVRDVLLRDRLHDDVFDDFTGAEAAEGLLPH